MELGYSYPSDKVLSLHAKALGSIPNIIKYSKKLHAINSSTSVGDFEVPQRLYLDSI